MVHEEIIDTKLQEIEDKIDADEGDYHRLGALRDALSWVLGHTGNNLEI